LLDAVNTRRLTLERLIALLDTNPRRIYGLPAQPGTWVEVDLAARHILGNEGLYTKCGWTPFAGRAVTGRVLRVCLRGRLVVDDGRIRICDGAPLQEADNGL